MANEYLRKDVANHNSPESLWVIYDNRVYDITSFSASHPGGIEWLVKFGGQDITFVMNDKDLHAHSKQACEILFGLQVGSVSKVDLWLDTNAPKYSPEKVSSTPQALPTKIGSPSKDFLDPNKPLFSQIVNSNFTKQFYLEQVHIPRHIPGNAVYFDNQILELFTLTPWYVVPLFWLPVIFYYSSIGLQYISREQFYAFFVLGILTWPIFEYAIHRFLFHFDENLPEGTMAQVIHFTLHGFHHFLPMDSMRLVMPPALSVAIASAFYYPLSYIITPGIIQAFFCGMALMYIVYDETHYWIHHGYFKYDYIKRLKSYHLEHHYRDYNKGFGITSEFWDIIFKSTFSD
ncbi:hypothetical protein BB561_000201 [Smittium simulii]|uniref:Ceramide very long chain fatty acid hydroxylase n=1 Tax=Smittium simulii TaxID=133385 RepID=A0A2T9Z012_9FUNG|nr:hypothetical protein BB561_000201 [Smittium simulii]